MSNWETSSASALECMVSMTSYWNAYKWDWAMQLLMAMVMARVMWSGEQMPPSTLLCQNKVLSIIGHFNTIVEAKSKHGLHLPPITRVRLDGRMPYMPEVEIWSIVSLLMFLLSLLFTSLHLYWFGSRHSTNGISTGFYHLWTDAIWSCRFPAQWMGRNVTIRYWFIVRLIGSYNCVCGMGFWLFRFLSYCGTGWCCAVCVHLKRGIM